MADGKYFYAVGRRKTSTAQVKIYKGAGDNTVNGKKLEEFCTLAFDQARVLVPFVVTETMGQYHFVAEVKGGGVTGQLEAIRLGIARALVVANPEFKTLLKAQNLMMRDPRMKERKKPYTRGARRAKQFSKR